MMGTIITLSVIAALLLFGITLKNALENDTRCITYAGFITIMLVLLTMALVPIMNYDTECKAKMQTLEQVGYVRITEEEKMDLSPNELKQFIEVAGVYFKEAEKDN